MKNAFSIHLYLGLHVPVNNVNALNTELEFFHKFDADINVKGYGKVGDFNMSGILLNSYFEFNPNGVVSPFFGAGLGASWGKVSLNTYYGSVSETDSSFTARLIAGHVNHNFAFALGARYQAFARDFTTAKLDVRGFNFYGGMKLSF